MKEKMSPPSIPVTVNKGEELCEVVSSIRVLYVLKT